VSNALWSVNDPMVKLKTSAEMIGAGLARWPKIPLPSACKESTTPLEDLITAVSLAFKDCVRTGISL